MAARSKLAVILHADVVGSTALVQADERLAHERIRTAFEQLSRTIVGYGGTAHEIRGDALVAEFNRASDALTASLAFQSDNETRNETLSVEVRPQVRIGIALGEVIVADNTVTGAGVVLAQRLEQLAAPGGVCLQGAVQDAIPPRCPFDYEDIGHRAIKGFDKPVHVFAATLKADEQIPAPEPGAARQVASRGARRLLAGALALLVLLAGGLTAWLDPLGVAPAGGVEPSIAVLPFSNFSNDSRQDYFGEGIAEDIITDLSKIPNLLVIARNSSFSYKGRNVPIRTIGRELGVSYVLEGSVRRAGDALRINAQLIDAESESHLWAERYDGSLENVFALQDQITSKIVNALSVTLSPTVKRELEESAKVVPQAYDAFLRGMRQINMRSRDATHIARARAEFQAAVDADPRFARAYAGLGWAYWNDYNYLNPLERALRLKAFELAAKSLALADNALARRLSAKQYFTPESAGYYMASRPKMPTEALSELRRGVELEPGNADAIAELAYTLAFAGGPEESVALIRKAMRLNPVYPSWYHRPAGIAHYLSDDYASAIRHFREWQKDEPTTYEALSWLAAAYAQSGDVEQARKEIGTLPARGSLFAWNQQMFANQYVFVRDEDRVRFMGGLDKAGLPDLLDR